MHLLRELVAGGEVVDHVRHPRDLGQVVVDPDFAGCRQPGLRRHRGSSIHRCDKVLGDYSTHYSGLRGVRHRRNGVLLRDCASQERQTSELVPPPRPAAIRRSSRFAPDVPEGSVKGGPRACRHRGPACTVGFPPMNPPARWHVSRHVPSRASRHSTRYRGFARASRGSAAGARSALGRDPAACTHRVAGAPEHPALDAPGH